MTEGAIRMQMKGLIGRSMLLSVLATFLFASSGAGEYYQYENEGGTISFTDNPTSIPKKLKKKKKVREDEEDNPNGPLMRVKIRGNRVLVPVTLCYRDREIKANFILDTGAEMSTISPALADKLNIAPKDADLTYAQGVGGGVHAVGHVKLD